MDDPEDKQQDLTNDEEFSLPASPSEKIKAIMMDSLKETLLEDMREKALLQSQAEGEKRNLAPDEQIDLKPALEEKSDSAISVDKENETKENPFFVKHKSLDSPTKEVCPTKRSKLASEVAEHIDLIEKESPGVSKIKDLLKANESTISITDTDDEFMEPIQFDLSMGATSLDSNLEVNAIVEEKLAASGENDEYDNFSTPPDFVTASPKPENENPSTEVTKPINIPSNDEVIDLNIEAFSLATISSQIKSADLPSEELGNDSNETDINKQEAVKLEIEGESNVIETPQESKINENEKTEIHSFNLGDDLQEQKDEAEIICQSEIVQKDFESDGKPLDTFNEEDKTDNLEDDTTIDTLEASQNEVPTTSDEKITSVKDDENTEENVEDIAASLEEPSTNVDEPKNLDSVEENSLFETDQNNSDIALAEVEENKETNVEDLKGENTPETKSDNTEDISLKESCVDEDIFESSSDDLEDENSVHLKEEEDPGMSASPNDNESKTINSDTSLSDKIDAEEPSINEDLKKESLKLLSSGEEDDSDVSSLEEKAVEDSPEAKTPEKAEEESSSLNNLDVPQENLDTIIQNSSEEKSSENVQSKEDVNEEQPLENDETTFEEKELNEENLDNSLKESIEEKPLEEDKSDYPSLEEKESSGENPNDNIKVCSEVEDEPLNQESLDSMEKENTEDVPLEESCNQETEESSEPKVSTKEQDLESASYSESIPNEKCDKDLAAVETDKTLSCSGDLPEASSSVVEEEERLLQAEEIKLESPDDENHEAFEENLANDEMDFNDENFEYHNPDSEKENIENHDQLMGAVRSIQLNFANESQQSNRLVAEEHFAHIHDTRFEDLPANDSSISEAQAVNDEDADNRSQVEQDSAKDKENDQTFDEISQTIENPRSIEKDLMDDINPIDAIEEKPEITEEPMESVENIQDFNDSQTVEKNQTSLDNSKESNGDLQEKDIDNLSTEKNIPSTSRQHRKSSKDMEVDSSFSTSPERQENFSRNVKRSKRAKRPEITPDTSDDEESLAKLPGQLLSVISNLYLDSIQRLRLDFPSRCARDITYCKKMHYESLEPNSPTNNQQHLLQCALQQQRYLLYISMVQEMCRRNEFPGERVMIELIELILSLNAQTYSNENLQNLYIKCIELFRFVVRNFPPCWRALRSCYENFFQAYLDLTKISSSKNAAKQENNCKMFEHLLQLLDETLELCSDEDLSSSKFDVDANQLEQPELFNASEVYNQSEWEAQQNRQQTFEALIPANRLERVIIVFKLLLFILENDFAIWVLHHHENPQDKIFDSKHTPLVVLLFELTNYTRCSSIVKKIFIIFAKATRKNLNPRRLSILERFISLVMIASNTADLECTPSGLKYPYIGLETKKLIHEFFTLFKNHNLNDVNTYPKTIEMLRQPFLRFEFINEFLKIFYFEKLGDLNPQKIRREIIHKRFTRYKQSSLIDPGATDELSQEQYINLLAIALKSYCEWHGCRTFLHVRLTDSHLPSIKTTTPTVHRQPNMGNGSILLDKMERCIDKLNKDLRLTVRVSMRKVELPKATICIDEEIMHKYRDDFTDIRVLQEILPKVAKNYPNVDFSPLTDYLNTYVM